MAQIQSEVERRKVKAALLGFGMKLANVPNVTMDDTIIDWTSDTIDSICELIKDKCGDPNMTPKKCFQIRWTRQRNPDMTIAEIASAFNVPESMVREYLGEK